MNTLARKTETQVATRPKALEVMATRLNLDADKMLATLKGTVFKNATNEELAALVVIANEYDLSPFLKELYAFPAKGGGIVPIVSLDGWNKMLLRQPDFDGIKFSFVDGDDGFPFSCTATIYVKGRSHPCEITEYFEECKRNTDPWNNMPRRMLRNRTLCQAARMAFGFSGVFHEEEVPPENIDVPGNTRQPRKLAPPTPDAQTQLAENGSGARTAQQDLESAIIEGGFEFSLFQRWGIESGNIENADSLPGFDAVPTETANRLLRNKAGLLKSLGEIKGAA